MYHQNTGIKLAVNPYSLKDSYTDLINHFSYNTAEDVQRFHRSFNKYSSTPLISLKSLAESLGIAELWIKDESKRFGLKAFKPLGVVYAVAKSLALQQGLDSTTLTWKILESAGKALMLGTVFVAATDGNHGRAVAWTAELLSCKAIIFVPENVTEGVISGIRAHGAEVEVIKGNYDDAVRHARGQAVNNGWYLVQDTVWEDSEKIPIWIMQGYLTVIHEIFMQLDAHEITHVIVPCGVGSFAGSIQAYLVERFGEQRPKMILVETEAAACYYQSMLAGGRMPVTITGMLKTSMAGLACGEVNVTAWKILSRYCEMFLSCPDWAAETGVRLLANPKPGDEPVVSGPSGAVTAGVLWAICNKRGSNLSASNLGLNRESRVVCISTEGDTDPEIYKKILNGDKG